jgi:DNA (cytosine-5)-methyltransferase 1
MSDGRAFELPTSVPRIIASDSSSSSLLPTPNVAKVSNDLEVTCSGDGRERPNKLGWAIAMLPTITASDADKARDNPAQAKRKSPPISAVSVHFPTPTASDATGGGQHPSKRVGHTRQLIDTILVLSGEPTPPLFDVGNV